MHGGHVHSFFGLLQNKFSSESWDSVVANGCFDGGNVSFGPDDYLWNLSNPGGVVCDDFIDLLVTFVDQDGLSVEKDYDAYADPVGAWCYGAVQYTNAKVTLLFLFL
jgi:hypothetical protein